MTVERSFDLERWQAACDRNSGLAVERYVAAVRRAAGAVRGTDAVLVAGRDLAAVGAALGAVLAVHRPRDGRRPARCRACSARLRPVGWPCATVRAVDHVLTRYGVLS